MHAKADTPTRHVGPTSGSGIGTPSRRQLTLAGVNWRRLGCRACEGSDVELAGLQALLDLREVAGRVGTVHQAVVVGQREVDHLAYGDGLAEVRVVDHHGPLDD